MFILIRASCPVNSFFSLSFWKECWGLIIITNEERGHGRFDEAIGLPFIRTIVAIVSWWQASIRDDELWTVLLHWWVRVFSRGVSLIEAPWSWHTENNSHLPVAALPGNQRNVVSTTFPALPLFYFTIILSGITNGLIAVSLLRLSDVWRTAPKEQRSPNWPIKWLALYSNKYKEGIYNNFTLSMQFCIYEVKATGVVSKAFFLVFLYHVEHRGYPSERSVLVFVPACVMLAPACVMLAFDAFSWTL